MNNFPKKNHNNTKTERGWYNEKTGAFKIFKAACQGTAEGTAAYLHDTRRDGAVFPNRRSRAVLPDALFRKYKADRSVYGRECGAVGHIGDIRRTAFARDTAVMVRIGGSADDVCRGQSGLPCFFGHAFKRKIHWQGDNGDPFRQTCCGGSAVPGDIVGGMRNRHAFGRCGQRGAYCRYKSYCGRDRLCNTLGSGSSEPYSSSVSFVGTA